MAWEGTQVTDVVGIEDINPDHVVRGIHTAIIMGVLWSKYVPMDLNRVPVFFSPKL